MLSNWANISETVQAMTNVYVWHIYKFIYDLSVYIMTFTLYDLIRSNQGHITFKWWYLINGASYDKIWHETQWHICSFSLTMGDIERSNQGHWVTNWLCFIKHADSELSLFEMHMCRKSIGLSVCLLTLQLISHESVHILTSYDCLRINV